MVDIYVLMQGIAARLKGIFPAETLINAEVIPQGIDHQGSMNDYIDIHLYKIKPTYTAINEMNLLYSIGIMCVCNAPLDPKRTAQQKAGDMATILQIYMGYHDNDIYNYILEEGYNWVNTEEIEIDKEQDTFKGSAFFVINLEQSLRILPAGMTIRTFCKKLYDYEEGLGGEIVLS